MKTARRWGWGLALLLVAGLGVMLAFILSLVARGPTGFERHVVWLFWVDVVVAAVLALVLVVVLVRLALQVRRGKFGSRLLMKLAGIFVLVGVVPGGLIYMVSYQFVSRSIETWFDTRVESALDAGLALGKGSLDALAQDLESKARAAADRLSDSGGPSYAMSLERLREQMGAETTALLGPSGQVLVSAGDGPQLVVDRPSAALMRQARQAHSASQIEGLEDDTNSSATSPAAPPRLRALALVPSARITLAGEAERYLMVVRPLPRALTRNALVVQAAYREYQQRHLARDGLSRMYIGTLTLALALSVFGAVLMAVLLGRQLARPLLLLAKGMRQVAAGDLGAKPVMASRDELGGLTRSFADMTEQLGSAREQAERSMTQLEAARTRLQTILDNLSAGVIMFDAQQGMETVNPGAARILRAPLNDWLGRELSAVPGLVGLAATVDERFQTATTTDDGARDQWQDSFEIRLGPKEEAVTLLVRGAMLPGAARLIVFDDISKVVSAQRVAAWSEVARRLAHEIKNPLTPIQLSAERLQHKLESKLQGPDQAMLIRSVATIVNQVQAMKRLVNEFRDYARLPSANMRELDLNALVAEVLALYGDAQEKGRLHSRCATDLPTVRGDATQLRQVIHNLVQNALEAVSSRAEGQVWIETERHTSAVAPEASRVRLKVTDNGPGFPDLVLQRAFEPYVTTKSKGTGLGLAVVKKIADEHGAPVRLLNLPNPGPDGSGVKGAQVSLSFSSFTDQRTPPESLAATTVNP